MQMRVRLKMLIFLTCLLFSLYTMRYILTLITLIIIFLVFVLFYYRILRTSFLMRFLVGCHLLQKLSTELIFYLEHLYLIS
jgi:hypothetical protein